MHIVIIDDEKILSKSIESQLTKYDYTVTLVENYTDFNKWNYPKMTDLFLVDISLWDGSGFDVIKKIKASEETKNTPVIFISWHGDTKTIVEGLDSGADDYIVKPFDTAELLARMRKCLRSNNTYAQWSEIVYKNITFDTNHRKVFIDEKEVLLSRKEKQILEFFLLNPEKCISKQDLEGKFWWNTEPSMTIDNTMNVTICNLRKKIWWGLELETIVWEWYYLR